MVKLGRNIDTLARAARNAKPAGILAKLDAKARSENNKELDRARKEFVASVLEGLGVMRSAILFDACCIRGRDFQFDVSIRELKLAIDIHGAVYSQGGHTRGKGYTDDRQKARLAQLQGWLYLEFVGGSDLKKNAVADIAAALELRR